MRDPFLEGKDPEAEQPRNLEQNQICQAKSQKMTPNDILLDPLIVANPSYHQRDFTQQQKERGGEIWSKTLDGHWGILRKMGGRFVRTR